MPTMPKAIDILSKALSTMGKNRIDINSLHSMTYEIMIKERGRYYNGRVDAILSQINIPDENKKLVKEKLLEPIDVDGKEYSNFMEEVSRRVSQAFQPLSGNLAELIVEWELNNMGLKKDIHYRRRIEHTDFIIFYPNVKNPSSRHRIEVKNVSLRERATRGLSFDGDSLFGFFNQSNEFTEENVNILNDLAKKNGGFCYVPPDLLKDIGSNPDRFRSNERFGADMYYFTRNGKLPTL